MLHSRNHLGISILAELEAPVVDGFIIVVFSCWGCCLIFWDVACLGFGAFFPWHGIEVSWPAGKSDLETSRGRLQKQREAQGRGRQESRGPTPAGARSPQTAPGSRKHEAHQPAPAHELIACVPASEVSAPLSIRLAAVEDFSTLVVTLHCFWAAFPLISFSSEILSSPSSAADGTIYLQGCSQSEGC